MRPRAFGRQCLERPLVNMKLASATFWLMIVGLLLAAWAMLANDETGRFTFNAPLRAEPIFYILATTPFNVPARRVW